MTTTDAALCALTRALYGGTVDPVELAKSIDAADVHVEGPLQVTRPHRRNCQCSKCKAVPVRKFAPGADAASRRKKAVIAGGLLAGAGIEALAAKDTIEPLTEGIKAVKPAVEAAEGAGAKVRALKPLAVGAPGKVLPVTAGPGTKTVLQGGNFLVGLGAARELTRKKQPVDKALRVRVAVPLNPAAVRRGMPTLRARRPAGSPAVRKSALDAEVPIAKMDDDLRQVFGWANVSVLDGVEITDRQGDIFPIDELEKAAYDYVLDCRIGGDQHVRAGVAKLWDGQPHHTSTLIESMVFTPEKIEKMGLPADFPQGWWIGMQVHDEPTWQLIKSGKRTGFSVHGQGRRTEITKSLDGGQRRFLKRLDPVAVQAQQLGVGTFAGNDRLVKGDAVQSPSLLGPTARGVVDLQRALIGKAAPHTPAAQLVDRGHAGRAPSSVLTLPRQFPDPLGVGGVPRVDSGLLAKVDTAGALSPAGLDRTGVAVLAGFRSGHTENPIAKYDDPRQRRAVQISDHVGLRERAHQAAHPPAVRRTPTPESSAVKSLGYQQQTRKLDVELRSRPNEPYSYRVRPKVARKVTGADSKGKAYNEEIKNQRPHHERYTLADRGRLFVNPERQGA